MVWRTFKLAFCASALAVPLWALADEAPAPPPPPLAVKAQVGYVSSHGNTDAQTANAKLEVTLNSPDWKHDLQLAGLYGKSSDIVSAEMFDAQWQSSYNITNRFYAFGALHYDDDKFSGFQYQETLAAGGGYSVVKLKDATLDLQVGVGYRRLRPEEIDKDAAGEVISRTPLEAESGAVATATINGMYAFNSSTKLTEVVHLESGSANTLLQNDLGLLVAMSKTLSIAIAYEVKHNSSPPAPLVKTDSLITFNLTYAFPQ